MRKVLIVVIGLASFGALVGVQQASAAQTCQKVFVCDNPIPGGCKAGHYVCKAGGMSQDGGDDP